MNKALHAEDIAGLFACGCGCGRVAEWFHSKCHPESGLDVRFVDGDKILLYCHVCKELVAPIAVAKKIKSTGG
jgi:hypothetical protein